MPSFDLNTHVVLFPFMSKGHTIPIFDLARLLLSRKIFVTIVTTPANRPFFTESLSDTGINIIDIPFPQNIDGIPSGIESTDKLPSMSLLPTFATATKSMKPYFENAIASLHQPITFMITDGFLGWTLESANKFGIPRFAYYGTSTFASTFLRFASGLVQTESSKNESFSIPEIPWIKFTRNDFGPFFSNPEIEGPFVKFLIEQRIATAKSYGFLVNSFSELESIYIDYFNKKYTPRAWCIGPFCAAIEPRKPEQKPGLENPSYIKWLDEMLEQGKTVMYVAFGSQAEITPEQYKEIKIGLEKSEVNFLWVVKKSSITEIDDDGFEFENRVKNRGLVVTEWVDQREILNHKSVEGFLSHCGWNSVIESICAKVPILTWPMMAEQFLNAKMVVEELKIGLRVDGENGLVKWESLKKMAKELMEGEKGEEVRKKVKKIGETAINAVKEDGSSWQTMNKLILEVSATRMV